MQVLPATRDDLDGIVEIINSHIRNKFNGVLEEKLISVDSKLEWFKQFSKSGPYRIFIAKKDNQIIGYTCSFKYRSNSSFDRTIETSIYKHADIKIKGVGTQLYTALFDSIMDTDIKVVLVGIALPNERSIAIHEKFDFYKIGIFKDSIYRNGSYTSSLWMQKDL